MIIGLQTQEFIEWPVCGVCSVGLGNNGLRFVQILIRHSFFATRLLEKPTRKTARIHIITEAIQPGRTEACHWNGRHFVSLGHYRGSNYSGQ